MSLHFVSPGAISCACDAVSRRATPAGYALLALAIISGLAGWTESTAALATLATGCFGVSIGAMLVELRFM